MDARRLAQIAYYGMARRLSEAQQQIVLHEALIQRFGDHALPVNPMHHSLSSLADGQAKCQQVVDVYKKTIEEVTPIMLSLEDMFADAEERDMQAFADFVKSRRS